MPRERATGTSSASRQRKRQHVSAAALIHLYPRIISSSPEWAQQRCQTSPHLVRPDRRRPLRHPRFPSRRSARSPRLRSARRARLPSSCPRPTASWSQDCHRSPSERERSRLTGANSFASGPRERTSSCAASSRESITNRKTVSICSQEAGGAARRWRSTDLVRRLRTLDLLCVRRRLTRERPGLGRSAQV